MAWGVYRYLVTLQQTEHLTLITSLNWAWLGGNCFDHYYWIVQYIQALEGRAWMYLHGVCTLQSFWHGRSHLTFMSLSCKFNFEEPGCLLPLLVSQCWITSIKWAAVWEAVVVSSRIQRPRFSYIDNMPETSLSACRGGARKSRRALICLWGVLSEGYCHSVSPGIEMLNANMFHGKSNANHKEAKPGWMAALLTTMPAQHPCGPAGS